jgi:DNA-binding FadR family transcriptional regulator
VQPVRRRSLIDEVTDTLRGEIADGTWKVGQRIPNETELCRQVGVGRNTVREAVQTLVHLGLLERRQGSGTYVTATSEVPRDLGRLLSAAERREVAELRLALDVSAAALAARRRTDDDLVALWQASGARGEARDRGDLQGIVDADIALHRAVAAAAHNSVLLQVYDSVLPTFAAGVRDDMSSHVGGTYDAEHDAIVSAIADGDSDRAAAAARSLLLDVLEVLAESGERA